MRSRGLRYTLILGALVALAVPSFALAGRDSAASDIRAINAAVDSEPSAPDTTPAQPARVRGNGLVLGGGTSLGLPVDGPGQTVRGTTIFEAKASSDAQVAVQTAGGGVRALVKIDSLDAPERYTFQIGGGDVARLTSLPDGSVVALDSSGAPVGGFAPAWARDASGRPVPTHYEIKGTTITQVVGHRGESYAFPVIADPWWVPVAVAIGRCQTHRYCRHLMNQNFWKGVKWAMENLF